MKNGILGITLFILTLTSAWSQEPLESLLATEPQLLGVVETDQLCLTEGFQFELRRLEVKAKPVAKAPTHPTLATRDAAAPQTSPAIALVKGSARTIRSLGQSPFLLVYQATDPAAWAQTLSHPGTQLSCLVSATADSTVGEIQRGWLKGDWEAIGAGGSGLILVLAPAAGLVRNGMPRALEPRSLRWDFIAQGEQLAAQPSLVAAMPLTSATPVAGALAQQLGILMMVHNDPFGAKKVWPSGGQWNQATSTPRDWRNLNPHGDYVHASFVDGKLQIVEGGKTWKIRIGDRVEIKLKHGEPKKVTVTSFDFDQLDGHLDIYVKPIDGPNSVLIFEFQDIVNIAALP